MAEEEKGNKLAVAIALGAGVGTVLGVSLGAAFGNVALDQNSSENDE